MSPKQKLFWWQVTMIIFTLVTFFLARESAEASVHEVILTTVFLTFVAIIIMVLTVPSTVLLVAAMAGLVAAFATSFVGGIIDHKIIVTYPVALTAFIAALIIARNYAKENKILKKYVFFSLAAQFFIIAATIFYFAT